MDHFEQVNQCATGVFSTQQHIGIGRAEHGDGPLPLPCNAFDGTPIWVAIGPSRHAFGQIICRALVVISQGLHHHFTGHGVLRCFHRRWVWMFGPAATLAHAGTRSPGDIILKHHPLMVQIPKSWVTCMLTFILWSSNLA